MSFFTQFNGNLKEIFFYITLWCNMQCPYCYLGKAKGEDMPLQEYKDMIQQLVDMGAFKITLLGGEPTLHPLFLKFIQIAKEQGVKNIRVDTNGSFQTKILENPIFQLANEISFSLEGANEKIHCAVRPASNYRLLLSNIKKALQFGYRTRITMTVNTLNVDQIFPLASQLAKLGVQALNLHLISENGLARQNQWLLVPEKDWIKTYQELEEKFEKFNFLEIKAPIRFLQGKPNNENKLITCEAVKNSRVLIMPNLEVYSCPLLLDTKRSFAYFKKGSFLYSPNYQKNIFQAKDIQGSVCPVLWNEKKQQYLQDEIYPLCVSYKHSNKNL